MNFKNLPVGEYYAGTDIGTDSVGYAVTNTDYTLCKHRGEPMWGVTLFDAANQSADRLTYRTARRRLDRRKQRVKLLQELFGAEIAKADPDFFKRLRESALLSEDRKLPHYDVPPFGKEYHKEYPTIHHLILHLMNSTEKEDIRYIYTACAWLVAHRGHFLSDIKADSAEQLTDAAPLYESFMQWFTDNGYALPWECGVEPFSKILSQKMRVTDKEKEMYALLFGGKKPKDDAEQYPFSRAGMIKLLCGGTVKLKALFIGDDSLENPDESVKLDKVDELESTIASLDENAQLLINLSRLYDCAALVKILSGASSISQSKVNEYETHKKDLKELKTLIKKYLPKEYGKMFRSADAGYYSAYAANYKSDKKAENRSKHGHEKTTYDEFGNTVKKLLSSITPDSEADRALIDNILLRIDEGTYMPKQINTNNRVIPHQLYFAELKKILKNAEAHYEFLRSKDGDEISVSQKIEDIFTFRIPYFVGPLNTHSKKAWIERKASGKIYPWNFENMVDYDKSEEAFIRKLTGQCTYLPGEDVVPKNSLLYCKYTVLNEINNLKIDARGISTELKQKIFDTLFMPHGSNKPKVTYKNIVKFLESECIIKPGEENRISGIDTVIKSSMKPMFDFYRLAADGKLSEAQIEDIILHSTCIEDKTRFKKWLENNFNLSAEDLKYISSKKYSDFGRLSQKLLNGIEGVSNETGEVGTVMHFLWNTNDNLMQILRSDKYTFNELIERKNAEYYAQNPQTLTDRLDSMYVSNAVKRPILRTLEIFSDIAKVKKSAPKKIFVEMTRSNDADKKGKRTTSRKDALIEKFKQIKDEESRQLIKELDDMGDLADNRLQSEKLFLYYQQMGKCMYCGKPLDLQLIGTDEYNVDHIWPQSYIKDDSIHNNKVLVHSTENGAKGDNYPIDAAIRQNMHGYWKFLKGHKLINEEKYKRLTRSTEFENDEKVGFINRQLVETSQSTKAVATLLKEYFPETKIVYVKAGLVSEFRHNYGEIKEKAFGEKYTNDQKRDMQLVKCRSINDIHHANDAYLNIVVGNMYNERFTKYFNVSTDKYSLNIKTLFGNPLSRAPEVWNPTVHLPIVDKVMKNSHVHLTKYQVEQKGGLFNQTIYKAGNSSLVPRKKELDPVKYGGYNYTTASYFVLAKYKSGKKSELTLVPVELMYAPKFKDDERFAKEYVINKLGSKAGDIQFPLGKRVIKVNTVFSLDGFEVCLAGKANNGKTINFRSATTSFYLPIWLAYAKRIDRILEKRKQNKNYVIDEKYDRVSADENLEFLIYLRDKIFSKTFSKMPGAQPNIDETAVEKFKSADMFAQIECLSNLILYLKTNRAGTCDLLTVGGSKKSGSISLSANLSNWKYDDIRIVDRSASGLYETRSANLKELL